MFLVLTAREGFNLSLSLKLPLTDFLYRRFNCALHCHSCRHGYRHRLLLSLNDCCCRFGCCQQAAKTPGRLFRAVAPEGLYPLGQGASRLPRPRGSCSELLLQKALIPSAKVVILTPISLEEISPSEELSSLESCLYI